jgi:hypothetical protein
MSLLKPVFALPVFFIVGQIVWQLLRRPVSDEGFSQTMRAADVFDQHMKRVGKACL